MKILTRFGELHRRAGIALIGVAWLTLSVVYYNFDSNNQVFAPFAVSVLFLVAGLTTLGFVLRPCHVLLYRFAGALSVLAIAARAGSIVLGPVVLYESPDALFITLSQIVNAVVLFTLFWWFWQTEVRVWHEYRKEHCRLRAPGSRC